MTKIPAAIGPYSTHRIVGNLVYVSGQLPIDAEVGDITATTIAEQTEQSLKNAQAILASEGLTMGNVVKTLVLLDDINDFAAMNEVYGTFFEAPYPARSAFEVGALPKAALVEIELIAEIK